MVVIRLLLLMPVKYSDQYFLKIWKFQLPSEPLQERRASAGDYCRRKRSGGTQNGCRGENGRNQGLKIAKKIISSPIFWFILFPFFELKLHFGEILAYMDLIFI